MILSKHLAESYGSVVPLMTARPIRMRICFRVSAEGVQHLSERSRDRTASTRPAMSSIRPAGWPSERATLTKEKVMDSDVGSTPPGEVQPFLTRLSGALNSPFALFLLSSVLISGVARLYTDHKQQLERDRARDQEIARLAIELDYRATQIGYLADRVASKSLAEADRTGNAVLLWRAACGERAFQPTIPDLKNIHSLALVSRLKLLGVPHRGGNASEALAFLEYGKDSGAIPTSQD
jgi:hypothetical protein